MIFVKGVAVLAALALGSIAGGVPNDHVANSASPTSISQLNGVTNDDGSTVFTTEKSQLTILPATGPQPSKAEMSLLAPTMGCGLDVQWVHASGHVSGTINGVAVINCTAPAGSLRLHYSLIRISPYRQWGAPSVSNVGKDRLQNNRGVSCSEGPADFQGWAQGEITPPPGYTLEGSPVYSKYGTTKPIACGASLVGGDSDSPSESTTVTFVRSDLVNR